MLDIAAGVIAIADPGITARALVIVIGIWAIIGGSVQLGAAWRIRGTGAGWSTVGGLFSVTARVLLLAWPSIGAVSLAIVFGAYLVSYGIALLLSPALGRSEGIEALA